MVTSADVIVEIPLRRVSCWARVVMVIGDASLIFAICHENSNKPHPHPFFYFNYCTTFSLLASYS